MPLFAFLSHPAAQRWRARQRGIALPLAMFATFVVLITGLSFFEVARMEAVAARRDTALFEALTAAEVGLVRARAMCTSQNVPWAIMTYNGQALNFVLDADPVYSGHYVCPLFTDLPAGSGSDSTYSIIVEDMGGWIPGTGQYRIHAVGACAGFSHRIIVNASTLTYACFGWLTDSENGVYFTNGDTVGGWVYTNDHLNINRSPVFTGRVNTHGSYINYRNGGPPWDNPNFQQGITLNSPYLNMSALLSGGHITAVRNRALQTGGIWAGSNSGRPYRVTFAADGTVTILKKTSTGTWSTVVSNKALSTTNGAIYLEDYVEVSGTVNGQVTLATPSGKDITITDNLVYANPASVSAPFQSGFDFTNPSFDDKLGLIAGGNIVVKKSWTSDWNNFYIMASLLSVSGSFKNYYYTSSGYKTLHVLGGIAQDTRGAVGTVSNQGFLKDYKYDMRFYTDPPPHFPVAMYDFTLWSLQEPEYVEY